MKQLERGMTLGLSGEQRALDYLKKEFPKVDASQLPSLVEALATLHRAVPSEEGKLVYSFQFSLLRREGAAPVELIE